MSSSSAEATRRRRSVKRVFVLLRFCDRLRVPRQTINRTLESCGRVKELEFANNATSQSLQDLLVHSFQPHLNRVDPSRLKFYRTVSGSTLLTLVGTLRDMCGETLKQMWTRRPKIFMRIDEASTRTDGNSETGLPTQGNDDPQGTQSEAVMQAGDQAGHVQQDVNSTLNLSLPGDGYTDHESDHELPPMMGASIDGHANHESDDELPPMMGASIDISDDDGPQMNSTPVNQVNRSQGRDLTGFQVVARSVESFVNKFYDKVNKVPMVSMASQCHMANGSGAQEVGEVEEVPDFLTTSELDPRSSPSYDVRVFEVFMNANTVPLNLPILCLTASQIRLQSYSDIMPVCLIRYRLTNGAVSVLRKLMNSGETIKMMENCYNICACGIDGITF